MRPTVAQRVRSPALPTGSHPSWRAPSGSADAERQPWVHELLTQADIIEDSRQLSNCHSAGGQSQTAAPHSQIRVPYPATRGDQ